jgi:hypothetical protein
MPPYEQMPGRTARFPCQGIPEPPGHQAAEDATECWGRAAGRQVGSVTLRHSGAGETQMSLVDRDPSQGPTALQAAQLQFRPA